MNWMRKREHNILANAASLLLCGVLAGAVVAAAAFPMVAIMGLSAKAGADGFSNLSDSLDVPIPPQMSVLYASDGRTKIATFYDENRHDIPLSEIPQVMRDAIIAAEDQRFYQHNGVDIKGVVRAFLANQASGDDTGQGASTLTMQYVRQALTYGATTPKDVLAATEGSPERKIREIRIALGLEQRLTKDQILQNYLNIAAFGRGAYGIFAASQVYFNKQPKDLTLAEAALLAGLPKAPSEFNPATESGRPQALARRTYVLNQMVELGMISREQARIANETPIEITGTRTPRDCVQATENQYGFFCDFFNRWWLEQEEFGKDAAERSYRLKAGGYRITSSMDLTAQHAAKTHVEEALPTGNRDALMLAAIEPGTGYVRAMAANRNYSLDISNNEEHSDEIKRRAGIKGTFPNTTNPLLSGGGDISGYKGGSTFKLFTLLAALEQGLTLDFTIQASYTYQSQYIVGANDVSVCPDRRHWCPKNASQSMSGTHNMWTGFGRSVNTYFVPLIEAAGAGNAVRMAERLGIKWRNSEDQKFTAPDRRDTYGPFTLGVTDVVPLELANAYATVAAEGIYCEPMPVQTLIDVEGREVTGVVEPRCHRELSVEVARAAVDASRCPVHQGGGLGRCRGGTGVFNSPQIVGKPVIGKTGTSDKSWTLNFVLSTKQLTVATILADPDKAEVPHPNMGRTVQAPANYMLRDYMQDKPALDWEPPPNSMVTGRKVTIPDVTCLSVQEATRRLEDAGLRAYVADDKVESSCPIDTVATTVPTGTTSRGGTVQLVLSGGAPEPPPTDSGGGGPGGGGPGGGGPGDG